MWGQKHTNSMMQLKKLNNTPQLHFAGKQDTIRLKEMQTLRPEVGEGISRTEGTIGQCWVRRGQPFWAQVFHQSKVYLYYFCIFSQPAIPSPRGHSVNLWLIFQGCLNMTSQTLQSSRDLEALAVTKGIFQQMFPRLGKNSLLNIGLSTWIFLKAATWIWFFSPHFCSLHAAPISAQCCTCLVAQLFPLPVQELYSLTQDWDIICADIYRQGLLQQGEVCKVICPAFNSIL